MFYYFYSEHKDVYCSRQKYVLTLSGDVKGFATDQNKI